MTVKSLKTNEPTEMSDSLGLFDTPSPSYADIDSHIARGRRLRAEAVADCFAKAKVGLIRPIARLLKRVLLWFRSPPNRTVRVIRGNKKSTTRAIAELKAYSDAELADLGIARASIPTVVRDGRPGFVEHRRAS